MPGSGKRGPARSREWEGVAEPRLGERSAFRDHSWLCDQAPLSSDVAASHLPEPCQPLQAFLSFQVPTSILIGDIPGHMLPSTVGRVTVSLQGGRKFLEASRGVSLPFIP